MLDEARAGQSEGVNSGSSNCALSFLRDLTRPQFEPLTKFSNKKYAQNIQEPSLGMWIVACFLLDIRVLTLSELQTGCRND
jgi:hypothetical protein